MRHEPLFTIWLIKCPSLEALADLQRLLPSNIHSESYIKLNLRTFGNREEKAELQTYRIGDFFEDVRLLPGPADIAASCRLRFARHPDAGRFWKDVMAKIIQIAVGLGGNATSRLEYRGDEVPAHVT